MTADDRTVQVPVSRIRDTVDSAMQKHAWGILLPLQDQEFTAVVEDVTVAVAALLSQPTPTAEPTCRTCSDPIVMVTPEGGRPWYWVHAFGPRRDHEAERAAAEPPRIEDMAPGTNALLSASVTEAFSGLSVMENRVLFCWASGHTLGETAEELGVAQSTVKTYRERIRSKTGLRDPHLALLRQSTH